MNSTSIHPPGWTVSLRGRRAVPALVAFAATGLMALAPPPCHAADLTALDLTELMQVKITSVSKRPEVWFGSAAAVDVITGEDIRRSGAQQLPDALRGSPGLAVARLDSHTWAISPRGFNSEIASKTLVLMDGRSVYNLLNGGVYWDAQDTVLEDIDRVEVIRGPGGTLWGANAVNGVINVITKSAKDTQGLLAEGGRRLARTRLWHRPLWWPDWGHRLVPRVRKVFRAG